MVGSRPVAYFYNYIYKGKVYFYLSGLEKIEKSILKPGLLGHSLSIERYLQRGLDYYDFMGGGERYKKSLAIKRLHLYKVTFQKNFYKFKLETLARKAKRSIFGGG